MADSVKIDSGVIATTNDKPRPEQFDVLIVGAGLSGIGAAYHLQTECPGKSFVILEARNATGGTWDLFRYPGIRSDSDMFTLGLSLSSVARVESDCRRAFDSALHTRNCQRARHRPQNSVRPSRYPRVLVIRRRTMDGGGDQR